MKIALIGIGHQGKHHLKFLKAVPGIEPVLLVDIIAEKSTAAGKEHQIAHDVTYVPYLPLFDAAIVAVPTSDHFAIASDLIGCGKHVLIEKPVTATVEQARELAILAAKQEAVRHADVRVAVLERVGAGRGVRKRPVIGVNAAGPPLRRLLGVVRLLLGSRIGLLFELPFEALNASGQ